MAKSSQRGKTGASKHGDVTSEGMSSPTRSTSGSTTGTTVPSWVPIGLVAVSLATVLLAIYQWHELLTIQQGGTTFCEINATFNCSTVWDSRVAKAIHGLTRVPLAGWGIVWGIVALASSAAVYRATQKGALTSRIAAPLWIAAAAGVLTSLGLFGVSTSLGVWCVTCLTTYALVAVITGLVFKLPRPTAEDWMPGVGRGAALVAAGYLVVLYPGLNTPVEAAKSIHAKEAPKDPTKGTTPTKSTGDLLADYLIQLPDNVKPGLAAALAEYRQAPELRDTSKWPTRRTIGAPVSSVRIVEFSDIRCGHCRMFSDALSEITQSSPQGAYSLELRQFPLDGGCNPNVRPEMTDPSGARCTAAKALICLEPLDGFRAAQEKMFSEQERLTRDRVMEIALGAGIKLDALMKCIDAPETAAKLTADIDYAMAFHIEGTPLVVVNGKEAQAVGQFVYALVLAGGNVSAPGWNVLPPPPAAPPQQP